LEQSHSTYRKLKQTFCLGLDFNLLYGGPTVDAPEASKQNSETSQSTKYQEI